MHTLVLLAGGGLFLYALVYKPEYVAVLFFTLTIADINLSINGLPFNMRALVGILFFCRTLLPNKESGIQIPNFFSNSSIKQVLTFLFYVFLITAIYDLLESEFKKTFALTIISGYCGYIYYFKNNNHGKYLKISLIISGIICFADLAYTYAVIGEFPVRRIYEDLFNVPIEFNEWGKPFEKTNHNFYGLICGTCFVYSLNEFINNNLKKILILLLPIMFLGVIMSTSRSSLLAIFVISTILVFKELRNREKASRIYKGITLLIGSFFLSLLGFTILQNYLDLNSAFLENITLRLIDEPIAVLNKHLGNSYNVQSLDAMDWREEASANAFDSFLNLNIVEQIFGIGNGGFLSRNLGHGLNPHNGMLLLVIESGIIGLLFYVVMLYSIIRKSFRFADLSPLIPSLAFVVIYCIGQNGELTSSTTFLFIVTLIAENQYKQEESHALNDEQSFQKHSLHEY